jgi:hypothetical protein
MKTQAIFEFFHFFPSHTHTHIVFVWFFFNYVLQGVRNNLEKKKCFHSHFKKAVIQPFMPVCNTKTLQVPSRDQNKQYFVPNDKVKCKEKPSKKKNEHK